MTHDGLSWNRGTTLNLNYSVSFIHTKVLIFIISVFFLSLIMDVNRDEISSSVQELIMSVGRLVLGAVTITRN